MVLICNMKRSFFYLSLTLIVLLSIITTLIFLFPANANCRQINAGFNCSERLVQPYGIVSHVTRWGERYDYKLIDDEFRLCREIGINWVRADFDFTTLFYDNGKVNVNTFDQVVDKALRNGLNVLPILTNFDAKNRAWHNFPNYYKYLDTLSNRYCGIIKYWETLNEIDLYKDKENIEKYYFNFLKEVRNKMKSDCSDSKFLSSGFAGAESNLALSFFNSDLIDIFNFHYYGNYYDIIPVLDRYQKRFKVFNSNKEVWITECGYSSITDSTLVLSKNDAERIQAEILAPFFLTCFAYGINKVFWYNLRSFEGDDNNKEDHFGLMHNDLTPKPAFYAYKTLIQMCPNGSLRPTLFVDGNVTYAKWKRPDNMYVLSFWANSRRVIKISNPNRVSIYSFVGKKISNTKHYYDISKEIVFFISKSPIEFDIK